MEKGMSTLQGKSISAVGVIVAIASIVSNLAVAQSQTLPPAAIADNDNIYIDGKTFAITPGRAKGDISAQIEALGARDLGPGAIIFRSGEGFTSPPRYSYQALVTKPVRMPPFKTVKQIASRANMSCPKAPNWHVKGAPCPRGHAGDIESVSSARGVDHQNHGMRHGEFLVQPREFQTDGDHLLRAFAAHFAIPA